MKLLSRESKVEGRVRARERGLALVGSSSRPSTPAPRHPRGAFTLLEVIIACAIFFLVAFSILEMVTRSLAAAKSLQKHEPDPGIVLHKLSLITATNSQFEEGTLTGDYEDIAPGMYPGYRFEAFLTEIGSNGLFQVDVLSYNTRRQRENPATITALFWCPNCKPGSATKGRP
jgi:Tfp pilus assembly protein PilV